MKKQIATTAAPAAIGPYSQAIDLGNMVFISGQIPVNPATGEVPEGIAAQTAQSIANIKAILAEAGLSFDSRAIAPKIGVPPFVAGKYLAQAAKFKASVLRGAVEKCVEAEEAVKTGRMNDRMSVEILILSVL